MIAVLTWLVLLPAATWLLGAVLGLIDHVDPGAALRRIAWRSTPFLLAALLLGGAAGAPALAALASALLLHVGWQWLVPHAVRHRWLMRDD